MRRLMPLALLFFAACDDSSVFDPESLDVPANTSPSFTPDGAPTGKSIRLTGSPVNATDLDLMPVAGWTDTEFGPHLRTADVLLRIDPAAQAEVIQVRDGNWCGGNASSVNPTGHPGEWRIVRSAAAGDCCVADPDPWGYGSGPYWLGRIRVRIHQPGTWRVNLVAGSATPACECGGDCPSNLAFAGGSVKDR